MQVHKFYNNLSHLQILGSRGSTSEELSGSATVKVKTKNETATARYTRQWTKLSANFRTPSLQTTFNSEDPKNNRTNSSTQHSPQEATLMKKASSSQITYRCKQIAGLTRQYYPGLYRTCSSCDIIRQHAHSREATVTKDLLRRH